MNQSAAPQWGYVFYPEPSPDFSVHTQLDVNICATATGLHYDPERLTVPIIKQDGTIQNKIIMHPWRGSHHLRIGYGRIVIRDRKNKIVEAYSLGGDLAITVSPACTSCCLTSPVPLFRLGVESGSPENLAADVVDKFEAMVAIRRARWGADEMGFQQHLTSICPSELYAAGLQSLQSELSHLPAKLRGQRYRQTAHAIDVAIDGARESGQWPATPLTLDELIVTD